MQSKLNKAPPPVLLRLHLSESNLPLDDYRELSDEIISNINQYPDPDCAELKKCIAHLHSCKTERIFVGNGSDEIIRLISSARKKSSPKVQAIVSEGTFPGHLIATMLSSYSIKKVPLCRFAEDIREISQQISEKTSLVFLCNPHNPCGTANKRNDLVELCSKAKSYGVWVAVDEAYIDFAEPNYSSLIGNVSDFDNLVVIRTLSKSHGLAGLRVGYSISNEQIQKQILNEASSTPFNVNSIAQIIAKHNLERPEHSRQIISRSKKLIKRAEAILKKFEIQFVKSNTNFTFFCPINTELFHKVASKFIAVRDCTAFGHKGWIRCSLACEKDLEYFKLVVSRYNKAVVEKIYDV